MSDNKQAKKESVKILKQIKIKTEKSQQIISRYGVHENPVSSC